MENPGAANSLENSQVGRRRESGCSSGDGVGRGAEGVRGEVNIRSWSHKGSKVHPTHSSKGSFSTKGLQWFCLQKGPHRSF